MPITVDTIEAGFQPPSPFMKSGIAMSAFGGLRAYNPRYVAGVPGAATAPSSGINGAAVTNAFGAFRHADPVSPLTARLGRFGINSNVAGTAWLIDRLWENSGLSATSTTAQAITPAALPARDRNGTTNGDDVMAAVEWSGTGGGGTPTVTLTYTDSDGNTGATGTLTAVSFPPVGTFELFTLADGDRGVRAPTSFIQSSTRSAGTMHLVLFRMLAMVEVNQNNIGNIVDALTGGLPRLWDGTTYDVLWFPSATLAVNLTGTLIETQVDPN